MNNDKSSGWNSLKSTIDDNRDSFSSITIPLISSQPILAVSPKFILVNEYTRKRKRFIIINDSLGRFTIKSPITETIIDAVWYDNDEKFFLLTALKIYTLDPNSKNIEIIANIKSNILTPFKSFTVINNQSSLLIAYNEWESKFIDRWQQDNDSKLWKLSKRHPLNLTANEFIGNILAINEEDDLNIGITIYDNLTEEWRIELRHGDMLICFKRILLPNSDPLHDYKMIVMKTPTSDIKWLVYSQITDAIIAIDSNWNKRNLNYKFPVYKMVEFKDNTLIVRTRNRLDIHFFI